MARFAGALLVGLVRLAPFDKLSTGGFMTITNFLVPPPELVAQWFLSAKAMPVDQWVTDVATKAARWGADQELEACVNYIDNNMSGNKAREFRAIRRPKPPSLKEQALKELRQLPIDPELGVCASALDTIRRALEALDD
jgi:hypothetical protein